MLHAARWKCRTQKSPKIRHMATIEQLYRAISSQLRHAWTIGKKLFKNNISPTRPHNMVNFGLIACEILSLVWDTQLISFFFPRLISAVVDWMSTILLHMLWPQCKFRMQV